MTDFAPRALPLVSTDLPGTGGLAKVGPEDFVVEEIPAYLPGGSGEHLYLWIEKTGLSTHEVVRIVAKAMGVSEREIGYAGQKDRQAVTRQWLSVHTTADGFASEEPRLRVLTANRHSNKLRLGHSNGNRFVVTLRGTKPEAATCATAILTRLGEQGLPNFFGEQRFGRHGDNAQLGAALLGVGAHPQLDRARRDAFLRRLALSALQSEVFNRVLATRLSDGLWTRVLNGDVLRKRVSGGVFVTTDPPTDQPRVDAQELDITGPLPGHRERPGAAGAAAEREDAVLAEMGLTRGAFAAGGSQAEGTRRPLRVPVEGASVRSTAPDGLELTFTLPAGCYATRVLAEVTKAGVELPADG